MSESVVLHQFLSSHFNEKARWALDWKRVPHRRVSYLPGPHLPQIKRMTGQSAVPVLALGGELVVGSARILEALEKRYPERPLFPSDPRERMRAGEIIEEFDREVGPAVRTALFSVLIGEADYLCRVFSHSKPALSRAFYRALFPLARGVIAKANGANDPAGVARAFERAQRALDFVEKQVNASGQLVGDRFTAADLTCAALLAPLTSPPHPDMRKPEPIPAMVRAFLARFEKHPAIAWVNRQYELHRPASAATR